jgi:hypothetical protein
MDLAFALMDKYGITEEEIPTEAEQIDQEQDWIVQNEAPVAWMEMLLITLCDLLYGGTVVPMIGPGGWRLYVVSDRGTVDMKGLSAHYAFLEDDVDELTERFKASAPRSKRTLESFSIGVVYGITEMLFEEMHGCVPKAEQIPFMFDKALKEAETVEMSSQEQQVALANEVFQNALATKTSKEKDGMVEIQPDWWAFDMGKKAAHTKIKSVRPPESDE